MMDKDPKLSEITDKLLLIDPDIQERENLPKTSEAWGDQHFMPVNLSTVDKIAAQNVDDARKSTTDNIKKE